MFKICKFVKDLLPITNKTVSLRPIVTVCFLKKNLYFYNGLCYAKRFFIFIHILSLSKIYISTKKVKKKLPYLY